MKIKNIKSNLKLLIKNKLASLDNLPKIKKEKKVNSQKWNLSHISAFSHGNAGDIILPIVLRDLFCVYFKNIKWKGFHVYKRVNDSMLDHINKSGAVVI